MMTPPRNERFVAVHVEHVAKSHTHHENRIHDRFRVVRTDEWHAESQNVSLAFNLDDVLAVHIFKSPFMNAFGETGVDAGHRIRRLNSVKDFPRRRAEAYGLTFWQLRDRSFGRERPSPFAF